MLLMLVFMYVYYLISSIYKSATSSQDSSLEGMAFRLPTFPERTSSHTIWLKS